MTHNNAAAALGPRPWPDGETVVVDAILFDLDGTLIDSTEATEKCWREWARRLELGEYGEHPHGVPARDVVAQHVEPARREEALRLIVELEVAETDGIHIKDGVRELLDGLPAERWAIVTSCTAALAATRMHAVGIVPPTVMVTADDVEDGKPDPEGYVAAARRLGVEPSRCLVVEDAPAGVTAGNASGAWSLAVEGTYPRGDLAAGAVVGSLGTVAVEQRPDGTLSVRSRSEPAAGESGA